MKRPASHFFKIIFCVVTCSTACASGPYPQSDHFDGEKFFQPGAEPPRGFFDVLKWQLFDTKQEWPKSRENTSQSEVLKTTDASTLGVTFINHATFLLQTNGLNILTDPIFSERASPVSWAGPKRVRPPGLTIENLPPIDLVVISHNHYDHMDEKSIQSLEEKFSPLFIVPLGDSKHLKKFGAKNIVELDWWQSHRLPQSDFVVTLTPVQHWSARGMFDRNESLWGGYTFKSSKFNIYFGGDTGYGPHFKQTGEKLGPFDLSLIPIGAYEPRWFMKEQHMNPEEAVQSHLDLKSKLSLGCHFGSFQLTNEGIDDPIKDLEAAKVKLGVKTEDFLTPDNGKSYLIKSSWVK